MVFGAELDRPDRALDGIRVDFDAAVLEEEAEPLPVAQCIAARVGERGFGRDVRERAFQPCLYGFDQRPALGLADLGALIGRTAANARLDLVEFGDPPQRLGGNRRAGGMMEIEELAPGMRPAEGELYDTLLPLLLLPGQCLEPGIAVDLQHPGAGGEVALWVRALAILAVNIGDRRRLRPLPRPVVTRIRP